jgi:membrane fusion protein (multidrug efflux system)
MSKIKIILLCLIFCVLFTVTGGYLYQHFQKTPKPAPTKPKLVTTQALQLQTVAQTVLGYGHVTAANSVHITAQADGIITALNFKPGQVVHKRQIIYTLRSSNTASQLQVLTAQMQSSRQLYLRSLHASQLAAGSISQSSLQTERLQYQQDLAAYQQAKIIHTTTAPISGVITNTDYAVGDFIASGSVLATVVDTKNLELSYQLPNQYAAQLKLGQAVWFTPESTSQAYAARVSYIAPALSADNQAVVLNAQLIHPAALLTNQFGQIRQILNPHFKTFAIKQELMQADAQGFYVYLLVKNKVTQHYFQAGELTKQGLILVKSGLTDKDILITTAPKTLTAEQVVKVKA